MAQVEGPLNYLKCQAGRSERKEQRKIHGKRKDNEGRKGGGREEGRKKERKKNYRLCKERRKAHMCSIKTC